MVLHSINIFLTLPLCFSSIQLFLQPPSFSSSPLVYHAVVVFVRDGGGYSGYRNFHRSAHPQSTPKPADSQQKIKGDQKKKSQPSAFFLPPHPCVITAIDNTGHSCNLWSLLPSSPSYLPFPIMP